MNDIPEKTLIYKGLYNWYLQQQVSVKSMKAKRSHYCLLFLLQEYIELNLDDHERDADSFVFSSNYKKSIGARSKPFDVLFNEYFKNTQEAERRGNIHLANGYQLKQVHLDALFENIFKEFSGATSLEYVEINVNSYKET